MFDIYIYIYVCVCNIYVCAPTTITPVSSHHCTTLAIIGYSVLLMIYIVFFMHVHHSSLIVIHPSSSKLQAPKPLGCGGPKGQRPKAICILNRWMKIPLKNMHFAICIFQIWPWNKKYAFYLGKCIFFAYFCKFSLYSIDFPLQSHQYAFLGPWKYAKNMHFTR